MYGSDNLSAILVNIIYFTALLCFFFIQKWIKSKETLLSKNIKIRVSPG